MLATFRPSALSRVNCGSSASLALRNPELLAKGAVGEDVEKLQVALRAAGYGPTSGGALTRWPNYGTFDDATDAAVRAYQKAKGLTVDGMVGKNTWKALGYGSESLPSGSGSGSGSSGSPGTTPPPAEEPTPFYKQPWFLPVAIGSGVLLVGTVIIVLKA